VRSVVYRFPDLDEFERLVRGAALEPELVPPAGESVDDGEWVLAIFEIGPARRATSAAGRAAALPEGMRLNFEPRDLRRLADFAAAEARAPRTAIADPTTSNEPRKARVLVVDDDPDIRDVVSAMLEAVGLSVITADSGERALERARTEPVDLLVLDWNLPRMTGLDVCRALRQEPALATLPVLFLSANAASQDMVEAFAGGADDYVVKPFRAPELGARIFSLLRRAKKVR
jgi:two-component system, OmpR family, phosphate regulon response regulator PhoB